MQNTNDLLRDALYDPSKRLTAELEAQLDEEVEALMCGFDSYSVPYSPERGVFARPDFHSAAVEALAENEEVMDELITQHVMTNRDDRSDLRRLSKLVEQTLEPVARRMILKAWLGMGEPE